MTTPTRPLPGRPARQAGILADLDEIENGPSRRKEYRRVGARPGLVVTHRATNVTGPIVEFTEAATTIRDAGRDRRVRNAPGAFVLEGAPVTLVQPVDDAPPRTATTASGSVGAPDVGARVARAGRLMVEGLHDAELIEKVWGDDLRYEGVVVEPMHGADDLAGIVRSFGPGPGRRLGILLDHLVEHTKETRLASAVTHPDVMVRGHRFVDVWAAVNPRLLDLDRWPDVPHDIPWKQGVCAAVGADDPATLWRTLLGRVSSYRDLHSSLVGSVEQLIDFVTAAA
ncbi:MAG: DUF3097 family protein [Microthrixaceae bacterium]